MTENQGPLTVIATDITHTIEDIFSKAGAPLVSATGRTVAELLDDAADHVVETMPSDAPLIGGFAGLVGQLAVAVAKTGGLAANSVAKVADAAKDYVEGA